MSVAATSEYGIRPVGFVRSALVSREDAPRQGREGAPNAWLELEDEVVPCLDGLTVGQEIIVITWLHRAQRDTMKVHPRDDASNPLTGVFATRSADRPNPIGLHRVRILARAGSSLEVGPLEAVDGTPIVDLKPVLAGVGDG